MQHSKKVSDDQILLGLNKKDSDTIFLFFQRHEKLFLRVAFKFVEDRDVAKEIVTDTALKATKGKFKFNSLDDAIFYFVASVRNMAMDHVRKEKAFVSIKIEYLKNQPLYEIQEQWLGTELIRVLYQEIENLPAREKEVLHRLYFESKSVKETSRDMRIQEQTVRNMRIRAINKLANWIGDKDFPKIIFISCAGVASA